MYKNRLIAYTVAIPCSAHLTAQHNLQFDRLVSDIINYMLNNKAKCDKVLNSESYVFQRMEGSFNKKLNRKLVYFNRVVYIDRTFSHKII